jgi:hypothetical protein
MEQQTRQDERPTFALRLFVDNPAYAKEEVLAGLARAIETIRQYGV